MQTCGTPATYYVIVEDLSHNLKLIVIRENSNNYKGNK